MDEFGGESSGVRDCVPIKASRIVPCLASGLLSSTGTHFDPLPRGGRPCRCLCSGPDFNGHFVSINAADRFAYRNSSGRWSVVHPIHCKRSAPTRRSPALRSPFVSPGPARRVYKPSAQFSVAYPQITCRIWQFNDNSWLYMPFIEYHY